MSNLEKENKLRDKAIAKNEAGRKLGKDIRLTTWAIGVAILLGIVALWFGLAASK